MGQPDKDKHTDIVLFGCRVMFGYVGAWAKQHRDDIKGLVADEIFQVYLV